MGKNDEKNRNAASAEAGKQPEAAQAAPAPAETTKPSETPKAAPATVAKKTPKAAPTETKDVDEFIAGRNLPRWMGESIKAFAGWKSGKQVTTDEFKTAVDGWNKRKQGGGRK